MVALPAFKFIFLGIRQLTRPVARAIVARANNKRGVTYGLCIGLGRVSLGISGVIAEWSRAEDLKKLEARRRTNEEASKKAQQEASKVTLQDNPAEKGEKGEKTATTAPGASAETSPTASSASTTGAAQAAAATASAAETAAAAPSSAATTTTSTTAATATAAASPAETTAAAARDAQAAAAGAETEVIHRITLATPRSRSLLKDITFGPHPPPGTPAAEARRDDYDDTIFLDPKRTSGEVARVFIRYPYRSTWDVFRKTFLAPFPEKRLVDAGADLLIELVAYIVLALLLFWELRVQSMATATKEANLEARLRVIEEKINELAAASRNDGAVEPLVPARQQEVLGRLGALWAVATSGASLVTGAASALAGSHESGRSSVNSTGGGGTAEHAAAGAPGVPAYKRTGNSLVPEAPPPPVRKARGTKHDETLQMKRELDQLFTEVQERK